MKIQDEQIDKQLQVLMQQNEKAPAGFSDRIMQALPAQQQPLPAYLFRPLLSKKMLAAIFCMVAALGWFGTHYFGRPEKQEAEPWLQWYRLPEFSLPVSLDGPLPAVLVAAVFILAALDRFLKRRLGSH